MDEMLLEKYSEQIDMDFETSYAEGFAWFLFNKFGESKKVLEIGGGNGVLSYLMKRHFKWDMTIIDPESTAKEFGIDVIKEFFLINTDVQSYDLLIGKFICPVVDEAVLSAVTNEKPFAVLMCQCIHEGKDYDSYDDCIKYLTGLDSKIKVTTIIIECAQYDILYKE